MSQETRRKPRLESITTHVNTGLAVQIEGYVLRQLRDGTLWLENPAGEGMQFNPQLLAEFFAEHF